MTSSEIPLRMKVVGRSVFRSFIELTSCGIQIEGKENLPKNPPYLIAYNHLGWVEGLVPYILLPAEDWPCSIAKIETMNGFLGKILPSLGFVGIRRGEADMGAIRKVKELLEAGRVVATAYEGTRARGEKRLQPKEAKEGLVFLAKLMKSPLPIVPMAIWGQNELTFPLIDEEGICLKDWINLRKEPLHINIGEPFMPVLEDANNMSKSETRKELTAQLEERILKLLPKEYLGS